MGQDVRRIPMTSQSTFEEGQMPLPWLEGMWTEEVIFDGLVDWEFIMKRVDQSVPELDQYLTEGQAMPGYGQPIYSESEWVALVFLIAPAGDVMEEIKVTYRTAPAMILMGVNRR